MPSNDMNRFKVLQNPGKATLARLGQYEIKSKKSILTPCSLNTTSRGVVPHLTPDHVKHLYDNNSISGISFSAEDFVDKLPDVKSIPLYNYGQVETGGRKVIDLLAMPSEAPKLVSARRSVPVASPKPNTKESISIMTSEGFRYLSLDIYYEFASRFGADFVVSPVDIPNLSPGGKPGGNRGRHMVQRSTKWLEDLLAWKEKTGGVFGVIASFLPALTIEKQADYIDVLAANKDKLVGIAFNDNKMVGRLQESHQSREKIDLEGSRDLDSPISSYIERLGDDSLLRLYAPGVESPQQILELVGQGIDIFYADYVNTFSAAGIALDFEFPVTTQPSEQNPVKFSYNMWDDENVISMTPLGRSNNTKYGRRYKRAYVHHLLQVREMTAWVVLQIHNAEVNGRFFEGIRNSIESGTFDHDVKKFMDVYGDADTAKAALSVKGEKQTLPKPRGYGITYEEEKVMKEQGSTRKLNDPAYRKL